MDEREALEVIRRTFFASLSEEEFQQLREKSGEGFKNLMEMVLKSLERDRLLESINNLKESQYKYIDEKLKSASSKGKISIATKGGKDYVEVATSSAELFKRIPVPISTTRLRPILIGKFANTKDAEQEALNKLVDDLGGGS